MRRTHRRIHGIVWPLLVPAALALLWWSASERTSDPLAPPAAGPGSTSDTGGGRAP